MKELHNRTSLLLSMLVGSIVKCVSNCESKTFCFSLQTCFLVRNTVYVRDFFMILCFIFCLTVEEDAETNEGRAPMTYMEQVTFHLIYFQLLIAMGEISMDEIY